MVTRKQAESALPLLLNYFCQAIDASNKGFGEPFVMARPDNPKDFVIVMEAFSKEAQKLIPMVPGHLQGHGARVPVVVVPFHDPGI